MTEQELSEQERTKDISERLQHPDPDPSDLPAIIPTELVQQEAIAARILRSSLTLDTWIEQQKVRMQSDMEAWSHSIATMEAKRAAWRAMIRDWMLRNDVKQIKTPWFTASVTKGRTKKVIPDEGAFIQRCKEVGYLKAIKIIEKLVKAEADIIADTMPDKFAGLFTEEVGESGLTVRKAKE